MLFGCILKPSTEGRFLAQLNHMEWSFLRLLFKSTNLREVIGLIDSDIQLKLDLEVHIGSNEWLHINMTVMPLSRRIQSTHATKEALFPIQKVGLAYIERQLWFLYGPHVKEPIWTPRPPLGVLGFCEGPLEGFEGELIPQGPHSHVVHGFCVVEIKRPLEVTYKEGKVVSRLEIGSEEYPFCAPDASGLSSGPRGVEVANVTVPLDVLS